MNLKNSTILITGGTRGIGKELARQLINEGAVVIVTGRNPDALRETNRQLPELHTFQSDVSKPGDIGRLYQEVTKGFPKLNIVINNAGAMRLIDVQDSGLELEDLTREIDTNLTGTIQMAHRFLPHLMKQPSAAIVNVSSAIAFMPYSVAPVYSASKAGVHAYTMALRLQLQNTRVRVLEVIPPGVNTNLQNDWKLQPDPARMMGADKMAQVIIAGLRKDKPEIRPFLVGLIKTLSRVVPGMLMRLGHREFAKFQQLNDARN